MVFRNLEEPCKEGLCVMLVGDLCSEGPGIMNSFGREDVARMIVCRGKWRPQIPCQKNKYP